MNWMLMPLKRYVDFSGRSRRMEYWMWQVFKLIVGCVFLILFLVLFGSAFASFGQTKDPNELIAAGAGVVLLSMAYMIFVLAIFIPDIAVTIRRLHDSNRSGWWILGPIIPYFGGLILAGVTAGAGAGMQPGDEVGTGLVATGGIIGLVAVLIALVMALVLIVFMFLDGTPGPNRFGPDPKGRDASAVFS
jgi:uncharacterized membrane protein YhaH (DUF805 family)